MAFELPPLTFSEPLSLDRLRVLLQLPASALTPAEETFILYELSRRAEIAVKGDRLVTMAFCHHCANAYPTRTQSVREDALLKLLTMDYPLVHLVRTFVLCAICASRNGSEQTEDFLKQDTNELVTNAEFRREQEKYEEWCQFRTEPMRTTYTIFGKEESFPSWRACLLPIWDAPDGSGWYEKFTAWDIWLQARFTLPKGLSSWDTP